MATSIVAAIQNTSGSKGYLLGWGMNIFGGIVLSLGWCGLLDWDRSSFLTHFVAIGIEIIILGMTIGFRLLREQKENQAKLLHMLGEMKKIVYPHQVYAIKKGSSLSKQCL